MEQRTAVRIIGCVLVVSALMWMALYTRVGYVVENTTMRREHVVQVITVQDCQYIALNGVGFTHKANCTNQSHFNLIVKP